MPTVHDLAQMTRGWFIGPFHPTALHTDGFECSVRRYRAGEKEAAHYHRVATEYTVIVAGRVLMNGVEYGENAIIEIAPGEVTDFEALTDVVTTVIKTPALIGDKYEP